MNIRTHKITRCVEETITEYISNDEKIFKTEQECIEHEKAIEQANKLVINNPNGVFPYDVYVSENAKYIWVNLKNDSDISIISEAYGVDVSGITPGIYCIEFHWDDESYISSMRYSLENAFALLELAGYDTTTLKRKDDE